MYFGYEGYSCIQLMAVVDADYRFIYVDIGLSFYLCRYRIIVLFMSIWEHLEMTTTQKFFMSVLFGKDLQSTTLNRNLFLEPPLPSFMFLLVIQDSAYIKIFCDPMLVHALTWPKTCSSTDWKELVGMLNVLLEYWVLSGAYSTDLSIKSPILQMILWKLALFYITLYEMAMDTNLRAH